MLKCLLTAWYLIRESSFLWVLPRFGYKAYIHSGIMNELRGTDGWNGQQCVFLTPQHKRFKNYFKYKEGEGPKIECDENIGKKQREKKTIDLYQLFERSSKPHFCTAALFLGFFAKGSVTRPLIRRFIWSKLFMNPFCSRSRSTLSAISPSGIWPSCPPFPLHLLNKMFCDKSMSAGCKYNDLSINLSKGSHLRHTEWRQIFVH